MTRPVRAGPAETDHRFRIVPIHEPPDEDLVASLITGDESALVVLYDRYANVIFRAALVRVGDRQLAEEILQDTYLALWNRAELFDSNMGSLIGWLAAIARNRSIDRLRAIGRRPPPLPLGWLTVDGSPSGGGADSVPARSEPVAVATATNDPEIALEIGWLSAEVDRALAAMPPLEREVIRLAYYDELSQSEIAARLSWPLGTVKTRTRRALGRLRETLAMTLDETNGSR